MAEKTLIDKCCKWCTHPAKIFLTLHSRNAKIGTQSNDYLWVIFQVWTKMADKALIDKCCTHPAKIFLT